MAAAHAQAKVNAARQQLNEAAGKVDYVANVDLSANAVLRAQAPGAQPAAAQPVAAPQAGGAHCTGCGTGLTDGVKFCPQCGLPRKAPGCPGCGAVVQPGTKFCGQCGARFG
jgi:RNA polymerase subunit RPABC4/transcription elongation factor Spt4